MTSGIPSLYELIEKIDHDDTKAVAGRGFLVNLSPGQFLTRVEANDAKYPGDWFNGPFNDLDSARNYGKWLANMGRKKIRDVSALPHIWEDGGRGNAVEVVRIYQVIHSTPSISSVVEAQDEHGSYMASPEQLASVRAGTYQYEPRYKGNGHQISLPVKYMAMDHQINLVKRLSSEDIPITKN